MEKGKGKNGDTGKEISTNTTNRKKGNKSKGKGTPGFSTFWFLWILLLRSDLRGANCLHGIWIPSISFHIYKQERKGGGYFFIRQLVIRSPHRSNNIANHFRFITIQFTCKKNVRRANRVIAPGYNSNGNFIKASTSYVMFPCCDKKIVTTINRGVSGIG